MTDMPRIGTPVAIDAEPGCPVLIGRVAGHAIVSRYATSPPLPNDPVAPQVVVRLGRHAFTGDGGTFVSHLVVHPSNLQTLTESAYETLISQPPKPSTGSTP